MGYTFSKVEQRHSVSCSIFVVSLNELDNRVVSSRSKAKLFVVAFFLFSLGEKIEMRGLLLLLLYSGGISATLAPNTRIKNKLHGYVTGSL
ncbi:hypothetical protein DU002_19200 [Corallincola holothuriorum]|uniref:Uncharacterized protein n=1 Tax=Corallincola holothuriorum TaxID=2282215 RepID=A0A368MXX4_9GAMM|nr:hypothetical protein DU002_19200 [Corallincola holothuriorum]